MSLDRIRQILRARESKINRLRLAVIRAQAEENEILKKKQDMIEAARAFEIASTERIDRAYAALAAKEATSIDEIEKIVGFEKLEAERLTQMRAEINLAEKDLQEKKEITREKRAAQSAGERDLEKIRIFEKSEARKERIEEAKKEESEMEDLIRATALPESEIARYL